MLSNEEASIIAPFSAYWQDHYIAESLEFLQGEGGSFGVDQFRNNISVCVRQGIINCIGGMLWDSVL